MFGLFSSKEILSPEDTNFQIATYKWLLRYFGGDDFYKNTLLVLPTRDYFPSKVEGENEAAIETFNTVKKHMGMESWLCTLEKQDENADPSVSPILAVQNMPNNPLGTFGENDNNEIVITYNPSLVKNPTQLIATYAHELAHYLTATAGEAPPGGWENWEFVTDIAATFLGFGVFMANSAFTFQQYTDVDSQGWRYSRSGYLSEAEHIFALAMFLKLKNLTIGSALPHLKPNLKALLKMATKQISRTELINDLLAVKCMKPPPGHIE